MAGYSQIALTVKNLLINALPNTETLEFESQNVYIINVWGCAEILLAQNRFVLDLQIPEYPPDGLLYSLLRGRISVLRPPSCL